ncbi:hypothetical protein NIES21_07170 [Anabaenopsis circularis NIES-21]|uniref:Agarase n=1 Tax=Anabaenopsis circularis NIES-21 TaxID=1085406 RepID=A0A1Z4GBQ0_9CYAN|nr:hypothetical protein NIES21_07170 [Anabaenopsis circularis NIES-21]
MIYKTFNRLAVKCSALSFVFLITLLSCVLLNTLVAHGTTSPLDEVQIVSQTVVGKPGFFQVGQSTKSRWWFIAPDGKAFFYKGVTSVNFGYPDAYVPIVTKKYGRDPAKFRQAAFARLRSWNFNALGAWTPAELWDRGMPYTVILDFVKVTPPAGLKLDDWKLNLPDVFDPEWIKAIDAKAKSVITSIHQSKLLVGYFTDNELSWYDLETPDLKEKLNPELLLTDQVKPALLQLCLSLDPKQPAYQAAWKFVLQRHGNNLEQLARDWLLNTKTLKHIKQLTKAEITIISQPYLQDLRLFVQEYASRYFMLTAAAIHRYDRNHLILGCRFGKPPSKEVFSAVKRPWVDVVSANNYRYDMYNRMDIYYQSTHLPVLNTEFSWGHNVFSQHLLAEEAIDDLSPTERMLRNGENSLALALTHPGLVGYTWYRWVDLSSYKPPISHGLVNLQDEPNRLHTDLLTNLNSKAETIAVSSSNN